MRGHGDGTRRNPIYGRRSSHGSGGVHITTTAERNIVAANVGGIRDEAPTRRHDLRLIGRKSRSRVAIGNTLQPMYRIIRIGEQGPAQQLVVKSSTEDPTLRFVELGSVVIVVLDVCDQLVDLGRGFLTRCDRLELVVDRVALGQKSRPEVGLRLIVLEV
jgi:hypothetical protein